MIGLMQVGAVPLVLTMNDEACSEDCTTALELDWINIPETPGVPILPDLILSTTPPVPESSTPTSKPTTPVLESSAPTPKISTPMSGGSSAHRLGFKTPAPDDKGVRAGLEHIREVRQRLQSDCPHPCLPLHRLPQLSWSLPPLRDVMAGKEEGKVSDETDDREEERDRREEKRKKNKEEEEIHQWRIMGQYLRNMGDHFQLDHARGGGVGVRVEPRLDTSMGVYITGCLAVSLLCLTRWRLGTALH